MELTIYSYGYIDAMYYVLNGIAMIFNSGFGQGLIGCVAFCSIIFCGIRMSYAGNEYRAELAKIISMILMIILLLTQKTDMMIYDNISKKREKVDNLPVGFALPVGMLELFGEALTGGFEQAFTMVSNTSFREYGMVFGARLVQESRNWRIRSPEFIENMSNYIDRCVMIDAQIGHYYTPQDLITSDNIWRLVSENAGILRQVSMRVGHDRTLMSCKAAAKNVIEPAFGLEIEALTKKYSNTNLANAGNANFVQRSLERLNSNFKKNVEMSFKNYIGSNGTADQFMRQQMMMNAIRNHSDEYGFARASATQESNWMIAGDLASTYLPILLSVLKCMVYSSFIFLLPLLLLSGGWARYLSYLSLVASFQLWAPLNSILNMFIDLYSSNSLTGIADHIISFSTNSRIGNYTDKIVAVASGLQMTIPFLAFSIIQGGVSGFIHLAGSITGASQAAASQAANEAVTKNIGLDNHSMGNQQLYNQSGFKTDWNQSHASGGSSTQHMDGTMEKVTGSGNALFQSGVGLTASSGATAYKQEESHQGQVTEGIQKQEAVHEQDSRSASNAKSNTFSKATDFISHLAEREHGGESFNYESMGETGASLQKAVNHTKQLHDNKGYSWQQSAQGSVEASATISTPLKDTLGIGVSGTTRGLLQANNSSEQSVADNTNINRDNNTNESYTNLVKAASNSSWAKENSIDTSYSDSVRGAYEEQQRLEQTASISKQKVDDWHQAKQVVDSQSATSSKDMYQEVVNELKQDYGVDGRTAQNMADRRSPEAQRVWQKLQNEDHYVENLVNAIHGGKSNVTGSEATAKLDKFDSENASSVNENPSKRVKHQAISKGFSKDGIRNNIEEQKVSVQDHHGEMVDKNNVLYNSAKKDNETHEAKMQKRANIYEEDRIGKGLTSKVIGSATHLLSLGTTDAKIGAPDKESKPQLDQQKASNNLVKGK